MERLWIRLERVVLRVRISDTSRLARENLREEIGEGKNEPLNGSDSEERDYVGRCRYKRENQRKAL